MGNVVLLLTVGLLVNGPYALITTAVSAELGTHPSLRGSGKALATVTSIIDGTGSIGAAVGPFLAGALQVILIKRYIEICLTQLLLFVARDSFSLEIFFFILFREVTVGVHWVTFPVWTRCFIC